MADDTSTTGTSQDPATAGSGLRIPDELRAAQPEMIDLIIRSESMNNEERQYWIDILPIMSPDQLTQLTSILTNEREQLAAIDAKYGSQLEKAGKSASLEAIGEERSKMIRERTEAEAKIREEEHAHADTILEEIE